MQNHHTFYGGNIFFICTHIFNPALPTDKILNWSKLKEFADNNFSFDKIGRKFSNRVENTGKRRNCWLRAISPFPTEFFKRLVLQTHKNKGLFWKRLNCLSLQKLPLWPMKIKSRFHKICRLIFDPHCRLR